MRSVVDLQMIPLQDASFDINDIELNLTASMNAITDRCRANDMLVHPDKTESMFICLRPKRQIIFRDKLNIFVNNNPKNQATERKLLGIVIDQNLLWTDHVTRSVFQLSRTKKKIWTKNLEKLSILGTLDYCSPIWDKCALSTSKRLNSLQKRASNLILHHKIKQQEPFLKNFSLHIMPSRAQSFQRLGSSESKNVYLIFNVFMGQPEPLYQQSNQMCSRHSFHLMGVYSGKVYQQFYAKFHQCRPSKKD